jgi:multiple sugar transport system permease protein
MVAQAGTAMASVVWLSRARIRSSPSPCWRDCRLYPPNSEVTSIDGAGVWGKFRHITLPVLASVIATALLLRMIWVANSLDLILVMTGGGPGTATQTLPLYAFLTAWSGGNYGQGSALAVMLTILLLGVVITYVWRSRER